MFGSVYEKNAEICRRRFPGIIEYLERDDTDVEFIPEERDVSVSVTDVCGKKILIAEKGDRTYQLDSLYDSGPMLELWFENLDTKWPLNLKVLMYGLGNGMYVREFLRRARKDTVIFVHEPSVKMLRVVMQEFDISDILSDERMILVFWPLHKKSTVWEYYADRMTYSDLDTLLGTNYLNYGTLFTEDCKGMAAGIVTARNSISADQIVVERFGDDHNRNTFRNLKYLKNSKKFRDLLSIAKEGVPAIVVAAGPSLDVNINELSKAKGKCIIISTDTALRPLCRAGIIPDIAQIVDGKKDKRYMSEEKSRKVPLVCSVRSGNDFLSVHEGDKLFVDAECFYTDSFLKSIGCPLVRIESGGSVANSCFAMARHMGFKTIILVGQDLAYTGDKTHSAVTVRGEKETKVEDLEHVVMGVDVYGNPIRTSEEFILYKEWFESQIKLYTDMKVIDATEGGIKIEGSVIMSLSEAIENECRTQYDFKEVYEKVGELFGDEERSEFDSFVRNIPSEFASLKSLIKRTRADYAAMRRLVETNRYKSKEMKKLFTSVTESTQKIEANPIMEYVRNQLQEKTSTFLKSVNNIVDDEREELLTACNMGDKYLEDMEIAIEEVSVYVAECQKDFIE